MNLSFFQSEKGTKIRRNLGLHVLCREKDEDCYQSGMNNKTHKYPLQYKPLFSLHCFHSKFIHGTLPVLLIEDISLKTYWSDKVDWWRQINVKRHEGVLVLDAVNSWERETHLSKTFHLSACDWICASSFPWQCSSFDFLYQISKQHLEGGRGLSLNLHFSLFLCLRLCDCQAVTKPTKSKIYPLLKSHTSFPAPILSKLSTAEQSALLDQICVCFFCNIPAAQSLDYTIKLYIFAFQSTSPYQGTNIHKM